MTNQILITKSDGTREPFETEKLEESLAKAGAAKNIADQVIDEITKNLREGMTTHDIYKHAFDILHTKEKPVAFKYSLKRAVQELGPSGFPFEKYVAEIFKAQNMQTATDQKVRGGCVEHEIDVVAWDDDKLIMVEAKFHNDPMMKSDLKVILYVKARFEDLSAVTFDNYGRPGRKLDEAWLVTNTKFSSAAIEYGSCQGGIVMIGWEYPPSNGNPRIKNLHDMLAENKLHPVTCLTTLNGREKKALLDQGVVLCKSLLDNPAALLLAGVEQDRIQSVEEEIKLL